MKRANTLSSAAVLAALALLAQVTGARTDNAPAAVNASTSAAATSIQESPQGGEFRWHEPLAAGRVIEIKGVNGGVVAEPSTGGEVEVVATKRARRSNPEDVRIEVVHTGEGVTICAVYPNVGGEPNTCAPGRGGHMNTRDNDTSVNFIVRVPAGVRFAGRTVNGKVSADNLSADVEATTVNGSINVSTTGFARAQTVNGSINVTMGRADWQGEMEFKTVNGGIDVSFPASLAADVEAKTLNGDVSTDFPLTVQGTFGRHHMTGTIGGGGRELRLETVNGSVQIRRAS